MKINWKRLEKVDFDSMFLWIFITFILMLMVLAILNYGN